MSAHTRAARWARVVPYVLPLILALVAVLGYAVLSARVAELDRLAVQRAALNDEQDALLVDLDVRLSEANDRLRAVGEQPVPEPTSTLPLVVRTPQDGQRGAPGPRGRDGLDGQDGATGAPGPAGPAGPRGAPGVDGADGDDGATGSSGRTGLRGTPGATGPTGPPGPAGAVGAAGPQGEAGPAGERGPAGAAGPAGATGERGPAGRGVVSVSCGTFPEQLALRFTYTDGTVEDVLCDPPTVDPPPETTEGDAP